MSRTMQQAIRRIGFLSQPKLRLGLLVRVLCLALALGVLPVLVAGPASAGEVRAVAKATAPDDDGPLTRPDSVSAMVTARATGHQVEDLSQRTDSDQVFAKPDGTWTSEASLGPERVHNDDGSWSNIDTNLEPVDGGFAPKHADTDLVLSDGGDATFAAMNEDGRDLSWKWPTTLPAPEIDGNTATYKNAVDGGDLVVTATPTGFSHDIVLNDRPDGPVAFPIPVVTGTGSTAPAVTEDPNGQLSITTKKGDDLVTAPAPVMYDADAAPDADQGPDPAQTVPVDANVTKTSTGGTLTLTPDTDYLSNPDTQYPVTIDPTWSSVVANDTWVYNTSPTTSHPQDPSLYVGTKNAGTTKYRSFLQFVTAGRPWIGKQITSATLTMTIYDAVACAGSAIRAARVTQSYDNGTVTWNTMPGVTSTGLAESYTIGGADACPGSVFQNWNLTSIVAAWASGTANYGLRIAAANETVNNGYRAYRSDNFTTGGASANWPKLTVNYNNFPNKPSSFTLSDNTAPYVRSTTPTMRAVVTDPDGGTLKARYNLYNSAGTLIWNGDGTTVASGGTSVLQVPAGKLVDGQNYTIRAFGYDGYEFSGNGNISGSLPIAFTVDATAPTVGVTATGYTNGQWLDDAPASNTFTLDGPADAASFKVEEDGVATIFPATSGDATVTWNPADGGHSLKVTPTDKAGNVGTPFTFAFGNGTASLDDPVVGDRSSSTFPVSATAPPGASSAKLQWRFAPVGSGTPDPEAGWTDATGLVKASDGSAWSSTSLVNAPSGGSATPALVWDAAATSGISNTALIETRVVFTYPGGAVKNSPLKRVTVVPHAFGGSFPTDSAGPGQVALFTGEFQMSQTDIDVPGYGGDLTLGRSHLSMAGTPAGPAGVFGPGWKADLSGPDEGEAGLIVTDHTADDGTIVLSDPDGESYSYRHDSGTANADAVGSYLPVGENALDDDTLTLVAVTGEPGISHRLTLTENDGTKTIWVRTTTSTTPTWTTEQVIGTEDHSTTSYAHDTDGRVTWIFAPAPAGATCDTTGQTAGCRALHLNYSDVTVGAGTEKRLTSVDLRIYNPHTGSDGLPGAGAAMDTITVAKYAYDSAGRLSDTWDPRVADGSSALKTSYTYDIVNSHTVLKTITEPGLKTWTFNYDSSGRLTSVTRPQDEAVGGSDATWTIKYDLPLSGGGLPDLTSSATAAWGQSVADAPVAGAAVWGPDRVPASTPSSDDYEYASASYWTESGRTTNTAGYGAGAWQVNSTKYDTKGNTIWTLDAASRNQALSEGSTTAATAAAADKYAALSVYNNSGTRVEETWGPTRDFELDDGTEMTGRTLTQTIYDDEPEAAGYIDGRPTTIPEDGFNLPVRVLESATDKTGPGAAGSLFDTKETRYRYDAVQSGDGDGWDLRMPTRASTQDGSGWSTSITRFDAEGKVIQTQTPQAAASTGSAAAARTKGTIYYTPGTGASRSACQNKPEWAGLVCWHGPDGSPSSGAAVPEVATTGYSALLATTRTVESSGSAARTSITGYDNAGRPIASSIATSGLGTPDRTIPDTNTTYSATTGLPITVTNGSQTLTTGYDTWGRVLTQTDGTGNTSTTSYDSAGRVAAGNDGKGTYSYSYNGTDSKGNKERRGLVTSLDVGLASGPDVFTGAYDANGSLLQENYPGGITASWGRDLDGTATSLTYSQSGNQVLAFNQTLDRDGRVRFNEGPVANQVYTYDDRDRLSAVRDMGDSGCTTRIYGFSKDSDRTSLDTSGPASDGSCQTTTGTTTVSPTFDDADRITSTGYTYDALGRTKTVPAADSAGTLGSPGDLAVTYSANDMVATLTQAGIESGSSVTKSQDFSLDIDERISEVQTLTNGVSLEDDTDHFDGSDDSPAWVAAKTRPNGTSPWTSSWTRNVTGLDGNLALIDGSVGNSQIQISNLHGDIVASSDITSGTIGAYSESTEFGIPRGASAGFSRYGWLGAKQRRSSGIVGGLVLMGSRLYVPSSGRFLTRDPVEGGNDNAYTYPPDPINGSDLDGNISCGWCKKVLKGAANKAGQAVHDLATKGKTAVISGSKKLAAAMISQWMKQRDFGMVSMRKGRPAIHWGGKSGHDNRIEWDKRNGWHYNKGDQHLSVSQGFKDLGRYVSRQTANAAKKALESLATLADDGCPLCIIYIPPVARPHGPQQPV